MNASRPMNTRQAVASMRGLYGKPRRLPDQWRDRLPEPDAYYRARVPSLGKAHGNGWAQGRCPFHDDSTASLSVNLAHGGWKCFAGCGGGDLVGFHVRASGLPFSAAVHELLGVHR